MHDKKLTRTNFASVFHRAHSDPKHVRRLEGCSALAEKLYDFEPPPNFDMWRVSTDVKGLLGMTSSRGDRLKAVDRAYQAWIAYQGEEGIFHFRNAENLRHALETYMGTVFRLNGGTAGGIFSTNKRHERDRNGVMTKTLQLTTLISQVCATFADDSPARREVRGDMLTLMSNVSLKWDFVPTLVGSAVGASLAVNEALATEGMSLMQDTSRQIAMGVEGGIGVVALTGASINDRSLPGKIWDMLKLQFEKFLAWMKNVLWRGTRHFDTSKWPEIVGVAGKLFSVIIGLVLKEVGKIAGNATEIYEALRSMVSDAWTRSTLTLQAAELTTSDGAFAILRKGIDAGIRNRQLVSAWKMTKGATSIALNVVTPAVSKIADIVLVGLECILKIIYNKLEESRINDVLREAKQMWQKKKDMPPTYPDGGDPLPASPAASRVLADAPAAAPAKIVADYGVGNMPAFRAANYSYDEFMSDQNGAYLNFLDSLVNASPVLASVVFTSKVMYKVEHVLHGATPRSTDDEDRAIKHLETLRIQARKLYEESGFTLELDMSTVDSTEQATASKLFKHARYGWELAEA